MQFQVWFDVQSPVIYLPLFALSGQVTLTGKKKRFPTSLPPRWVGCHRSRRGTPGPVSRPNSLLLWRRTHPRSQSVDVHRNLRSQEFLINTINGISTSDKHAKNKFKSYLDFKYPLKYFSKYFQLYIIIYYSDYQSVFKTYSYVCKIHFNVIFSQISIYPKCIFAWNFQTKLYMLLFLCILHVLSIVFFLFSVLLFLNTRRSTVVRF